MTTEEAIKRLENFAKHIEPNEEFIMAIKALQENEKLKAQVEKWKLKAEEQIDLWEEDLRESEEEE